MTRPPIDIYTRCDAELTTILRMIYSSIPTMAPPELLKFMEMIVVKTSVPRTADDMTADKLYSLCAIAGYAVAQTTAKAIGEKSKEIQRNN